MALPRSAVPGLAGVAMVLLAACSSVSPPTPTPAPTATATPAPSPTALPPDTLSVGVVGVGIGTFDLATIPVARIKNEAKYHGAASVTVHFVTHRAGHTLGSLESVTAVNLAPGEILAVTGDCTDACNGATSLDATVTVGSWPTDIGPIFRTVSATYSCQPCHSSHGYGNVKGSLTPSATLAAGVAVVSYAVCLNAMGVILGGGYEESVWQAGPSLAANVPVVLNAAPATCALGASTGW